MATATVNRAEPTISLELSVDEAKYAHDALSLIGITEKGGEAIRIGRFDDPIYDALNETFKEMDVDIDTWGYAEVLQ